MIQNLCVASPGMEGTFMSPKLTNNGLGSLDEYGGGGEDGSRWSSITSCLLYGGGAAGSVYLGKITWNGKSVAGPSTGGRDELGGPKPWLTLSVLLTKCLLVWVVWLPPLSAEEFELTVRLPCRHKHRLEEKQTQTVTTIPVIKTRPPIIPPTIRVVRVGDDLWLSSLLVFNASENN
jgi:hypothetical protein